MKFLFYLALTLSLYSSALADEINQIRDSVERVMKKAPGKLSDYSIFVINGDATIYNLNDQTKRVPASLSKIPTAGAVLKYIPSTKKFITQILTDSGVKINANGSLKGNIYLKGGGDPSFVSETMWVLVNNLTRSGVKSVSGDVIVDDTFFDQEYIADTREDLRVDRAYDAPVSAMSFNWNSANIIVRPGESANDPALVVLDPVSKYFQLKNSAKTVAAGKPMTIKVEKQSSKSGDTFVVSGNIPLGHSEKIIYKNISAPTYWAGSNLISFLTQRGIEVTGSIKAGKSPTAAQVLASVESWPLGNIVADMMKFSNNYVAEMLTKHLSEPSFEKPGNLKEGVEKIKSFMREAGLKESEFTFESPSGFTRNNLITAKDLAQLLVYVRKDFRLFPEFLSSLPISGQDGTLKSRMTDPSVQGWVRAKTGMLKGTIGLAGYAGRKSGQIITFVFIYNGAGDTFKVRDFFDTAAEALVK